MSDEKIYRVARGAIRCPHSQDTTNGIEFIMQGEVVPKGMLSPLEVRSLLNDGILEEVMSSPEVVAEAERLRTANPFKVDPATLMGKSMEDLIIMVLEIDDEYDVDSLESEQDAVRLLTSGWDPKYRQTIAPVNDRSRPEALAMHKLEQKRGDTAEGRSATSSQSSEMSAEAKAGLDRAKARAQAPETEE